MSRAGLALALVASLATFAAGCGSEPSDTMRTRAMLDLPVPRLELGDVPVLQTKVASIPLRNLGRAALAVEAATLREPGPFSVLETPKAVEPGAEAAIRVAFQPRAVGRFTGTLVLATDDELLPAAEVALEASSSSAARAEADAERRFERVCEGTERIERIAIRSTGTAELLVGGLALEEGTAPEFSLVSSTRAPAVIPVGSALQLSVRYRPTADSPDVARGALLLTDVTDPAHPTVRVPLHGTVNRAPRALIADVLGSAPGAVVALDGTGAYDPESDLPLAYRWSVRSSPAGSQAEPRPPDAAIAQLGLDLAGQYAVQLIATDAAGCASAPAFETILAKTAVALEVELVWDRRASDLDLHLVPEGEAFFGPLDCYFAQGHLQPDWGVAGDASDDPSLERDALEGYGPERIVHRVPAEGRYRVLVDYYASHLPAEPATEAAVRIYQFGILKGERRMRLERAGTRWTAVSIDWPSGSVTPLDVVE